MVDYLHEKGETDSYLLASMLEVDMNIIGKWTDALEKAQMIDVVHKHGKMFLSPAKMLNGEMEITG
jgi:hypothetical protein